jgi:hypothetical protein
MSETNCGCVSKVTQAITECECSSAGFCTRHKCEKTEHFHKLCKSRPDYFALWESGKGPCLDQQIPATANRMGLGDVVGWLAALIGVRPWPGCGCDKRRAWLNRFIVWGWWRRAA